MIRAAHCCLISEKIINESHYQYPSFNPLPQVMNAMNQTSVTKFLLLGFQTFQSVRIILLLCFLVFLFGTICGNLLIIWLVASNRSLQSPMYFFLTQLSLSDLLLTTDIVPNALYIIWNEGGAVSFSVSYVCIVRAVLRISTDTGRGKAFSTCSSHLAVVSIFYGTLIGSYLVPSKGKSLTVSKAVSLLYTVFTPMINPIIYSLKNKDIKDAVKKIFCKINENK
uniref:G-protein coupled receptors family 1 profile domain-containing protein n=1 Tax=Leptobrachium leishanense TaxID=445787 RepID=A0A8C5M8C5_9ANUR